MTTEEQQELIDGVMDWFDFRDVVKMLNATQYGWWAKEPEQSEPILREHCRKHLISTIKSSSKFSSTGGFEVDARYNQLTLRFVPEEWTAELF